MQTNLTNLTNNENCTSGIVQSPSQKQNNNNNNNKGESSVSSNSAARRSKTTIESKAQAVRNKHKNSQNKEKHCNIKTPLRSELNTGGVTHMLSPLQSQINGQNEGFDANVEITASTMTLLPSTAAAAAAALNSELVVQKLNAKLKTDAAVGHLQQSQTILQNNKTSKLVQQIQDFKINGVVVQNGEQNLIENHEINVELQREGSTPASTTSSSEDSNANHQVEHLLESNEEINNTAILGKFLFII